MRTITIALLTGLLAVPLAGCKNCCKRPIFGEGGLFNRGSSGRASLPAPFAPSTDPLLIPPPSGGLPSSTIDDPPPAPRGSTPDLPPPMIPESRSNKLEEPKPNGGKELLLPDPLPGQSSKRNGFLEDPAEVRASKSISNAAPSDKAVSGVTGMTKVGEGLAAGRKPSLEGFDSLQRAGYSTVIFLHAPGESPDSIRTVAESRGLKFVAIAVSSDKIGEAYEAFSRAIRDGSKPIFVCDDDGARGGAMWFAWFRKVDGLSDDAAQVRAAPLGLRDAPEREKEKLLAAVRDFLARS